jgi:hypothetical protein
MKEREETGLSWKEEQLKRGRHRYQQLENQGSISFEVREEFKQPETLGEVIQTQLERTHQMGLVFETGTAEEADQATQELAEIEFYLLGLAQGAEESGDKKIAQEINYYIDLIFGI